MNDVWLVLCNVPDVATARAIAARLVESRAAACVNISHACESVYRWDGAVERATEVPLAIKTVAEKYAEVETIIRGMHPYQVPEIVAVPVAMGLTSYLDWVRNETA